MLVTWFAFIDVLRTDAGVGEVFAEGVVGVEADFGYVELFELFHAVKYWKIGDGVVAQIEELEFIEGFEWAEIDYLIAVEDEFA